ncbi:MAG TPA: ABC transporter permease [Gemmatimonadaceae bacterium]|nr:ABC transporter permease [Gemmatimonadaceae bacterium]
MSELLSDIRIAFRVLAKTPAFTIVTLLTLAVSIGATTAIFSVVDGVLIRPLPYPNADRIVTVTVDASKGNVPEMPFSDRGYWHFANKARTFAPFAGYDEAEVPIASEGAEPVQVSLAVMTRSAFDVLGVSPYRGRLPSAEEDAPNGPLVMLIGYDLWKTRFGGDTAIVGKSITVNGRSRQIIGIMPHGYDFPEPETAVWVPYQLDPASPNYGGHHINAIARLAPGATVASALAETEGLVKRFEEAGYTPPWMTNVFSGRAAVKSYREQLVGDVRQTLLVLMGTVGFVLLIACSNVANLLLLRAEGRTRETAVRIALGAGRRRVIRYVIVESLMLALAGGAAGVLLAYLGTKLLISLAPSSIPRLHEIGITPGVLLFTLGISVFAGLLFGVLPALRSFSYRMVTALRDGGRGSTVGRERHGARQVLVVTQIALALVLLVGSGLMVRSFQKLRAVNPGFSPDAVLTFRLAPPPSKYPTPEVTAQFYTNLLERLRALPGVQAAGAITSLPLSGAGSILATQIPDFPTGPNDFPPTFNVRRVTPGYFEAVRIPLIEGRTFENRDHQQRLGSAIISQSIKAKYWHERTPIGRRIAPSSAPAAIIGVVGDVHQTGLDKETDPTIYMPMLDSVGGGVRSMTVALRTNGSTESLINAVSAQVRDIDPGLPITHIETLGTVVDRSMNRTSFATLLLAIAAFIGLFLGSVGIYGVISYTVSLRTVELGIRQALGANAGRIRMMVLRQGGTLALLGVAIGIGASLAMGRVMTNMLYGVSAFDPLTVGVGCVVFLSVAVLACLLPARRAGNIAPSEALRAE